MEKNKLFLEKKPNFFGGKNTNFFLKKKHKLFCDKHVAVHVYNLLYKMADANIAVSDLNNYLPFHQGIDLERDELIELGLKYKEIYVFFFIEISVRYLKRILRQRQLGRRRSPSSPTMMFMKLCMRRLKVAEVLLVIDQCINDFVSVIILSSHEKQ